MRMFQRGTYSDMCSVPPLHICLRTRSNKVKLTQTTLPDTMAGMTVEWFGTYGPRSYQARVLPFQANWAYI
jgi:hypothetical protein